MIEFAVRGKQLGLIRNVLGIIALIIIIMTTTIYFFQENLLFRACPVSQERFNALREKYSNCEVVELKTQDNIRLYGWFAKCKNKGKAPLLIHFGGSANPASAVMQYVNNIDGCSVVSFNYRGYEISEGKASEDKLFEDALLVYDKFSARDDVDKKNIFLMGYSLGTGVATYVASKRECNAVILSAPFDSITQLVQDRLFFIPLAPLIRHRFDSVSRGSMVTAPLLAILAEKDIVILNKNSMNLVNNWGGEHTVRVMKDRGHINLWKNDDYWQYIKKFIETKMKD